MNRGDRTFTLLFLIIPISWAGSFIAGTYVVRELDAVASTMLRFLFSAAAMAPLLLFFMWRQRPGFRERSWWTHLAGVVLFAGVGYHVLFFSALQHITPTSTALIIALNPFFTAFGEIVFLKRRRPGRFYAGFLLAFSGALWVNAARGGRIDIAHLGIGEALALGAALSWAVYTLFARATKKPEWDSLWINGASYMITALLLIPLTGVLPILHSLGSAASATWLGLIYMAIFPTAIGYTFFYVGVQRKGAAWAATFIYLVPSFTAILDFAFFRAHFTSEMAGGTVLVVAGLLLGNLPGRKRGVVTE